MARLKAAPPLTTGVGTLQFPGFTGEANFSVQGEPAGLKAGLARMRGFVAADPQVAAKAFRAGEASLTLEGGQSLRLTFLGHTAGDEKVYFEARV